MIKMTFTEAEKRRMAHMSPCLSAGVRQQIIMGRREVEGKLRLHKTLKNHFDEIVAQKALALAEERKLPWDVWLELIIEVERRLARHQSSEAILSYLDSSAKPDLLVQRQVGVLHQEFLQAQQETAVERARADAEAREKQIERERADVEAREKEAEREKRLFAERQVALLQQQLDQLRSVEGSGVAVRGSGDSTQQTAVSSALGSSIKKRVFKADTTGDAEQAKKRLTGEPLLGPDEVAANEDEDINNSPTRR